MEPLTRQGVFLEEVGGKVGTLVELTVDAHGINPGEIHGGIGSFISTSESIQQMLGRPFRWVDSSELQAIADEQPTQPCQDKVPSDPR